MSESLAPLKFVWIARLLVLLVPEKSCLWLVEKRRNCCRTASVVLQQGETPTIVRPIPTAHLLCKIEAAGNTEVEG